MKLDIKSMSYEELVTFFAEMGEKSFRAKQLFEALHHSDHQKRISDFAQLSTFSKALREKCAAKSYINSLNIKKKLVSALDSTVKYLYELEDGNCVETVLMHYRYGASLCVSTQVGCRMGCGFCASTKAGLVRNLTPAEILDQVYAAGADFGGRISNIVLMGIGEPLDNFDNVVRFLELISSPLGHNLSLRHVSLSTCGLVDKINMLAEMKLGLTLSVSLHAVNDSERSVIMPVNKRYRIAELLSACKKYFKKTGRRISFEYALIENISDGEARADALAALLADIPCHVNLIPVNAIPNGIYKRSANTAIARFQKQLEHRGVTATVRRELGADIKAACGQLRHETIVTE